MFAKMHKARHLKAKCSIEAATVELAGKIQRIVRIHPEGLKDKPNRHSQPVQYDANQLQWLSSNETQSI